MKSQRMDTHCKKEHLTGAAPHPALTDEERAKQREHNKEFIKAMNELTAKAGLLSDDPYFGGI